MDKIKRRPYVHQLFYLKKDGSLGRQFSEIKTKVKFREYMVSYFLNRPTKEVVFRLKGEEIFRQVHPYVNHRSNASICFTRWSPEKSKLIKKL